MTKQAVMLIDVLNDFIIGSLSGARANNIISPLQKLTGAARKNHVPVIYVNDSHLPAIDRELKLWGTHAIVGTTGAQVVPELTPKKTDYIISKRRYSGFFQTDLHLLLTELKVDTIILTGLDLNICVRHTAADAFYWGYKLIVPKDATESSTEDEYHHGINYLKNIYGAAITTVDKLVAGL